MDRLKVARDELHNIDKELAMLFEKRMDAVSRIAESKKELGLPVENSELESMVISKKAQMIDDPKIRSYYVNFLESLVDTSKKYQHFLLKGMKIAFSGVEGAFANIAAKSIFPSAELVAFGNFKEALFYNSLCHFR